MNSTVGRLAVAVMAAGAMLAGAVVAAPPAQAERSGRIKTPNPTIKCVDHRNYVSVVAFGQAWLTGRPIKKPLAQGAYIKVTTELQAQAGYNGTLWKKQKRVTKKSRESYYPGTGYTPGPLPVSAAATASNNYRSGTGTYRAKMTVRVYREGPGIDGLTNSRVLYSNAITCASTDGSGGILDGSHHG